MIYHLLADFVLLIHLGFVLFVIFGGLLVLRWRRVAWLHVPAFLWGALIEFAGWICPLTPLENSLRQRAGEPGYAGGFIEHYATAALYPESLTRSTQIILGAAVLGINCVVYWLVLLRRSSRLSS
jgi:hypothetical protein